MTDYEIRRASHDDLELLVRHFGADAYFARALDHQAAGHGHLLVAVSNGIPVGDVSVVLMPPGIAEVRERHPNLAFLEHLEVAESAQRNGIGTALIAAGEQLVADAGRSEVAMGVDTQEPDATRLIAMYTRLGYVDWGHGTVPAEWDRFTPAGEKSRYTTDLRILIKMVR